MFAALVVLHVVVSVSLVLTVLLQTGRGAELGAAFGSVGQATFGRGQTTFIAKFTRGLAVVFMATSLALAFLSMEENVSSVVAPGSSSAPAAEEATRPPEGPAGVTDQTQAGDVPVTQPAPAPAAPLTTPAPPRSPEPAPAGK